MLRILSEDARSSSIQLYLNGKDVTADLNVRSIAIRKIESGSLVEATIVCLVAFGHDQESEKSSADSLPSKSIV